MDDRVLEWHVDIPSGEFDFKIGYIHTICEDERVRYEYLESTEVSRRTVREV